MAKKRQTEPEPWERQDNETPKQFAAFQAYRDMGTERSIRGVSKLLDKSRQLLGRWSSENNWVERCVAWDREQDRLNIIQQQKDIAKMRKTHANIGAAMMVKVAQALAKLNPEDMKPQDMARLAEVGSKLERISRGDIGEVVEQRDGGETAPAVTFYMPDNGRDSTE